MLEIMVVGGGAAGMMAAITAARGGAKVTLLERNPRIGKKILVTGNGRCNYTNQHAGPSYYFGSASSLVAPVFEAFSVADTVRFFKGLGIEPRVEDAGKTYPMSEQASSILDVLFYELNRLHVDIRPDTEVLSIHKGTGFLLRTTQGAFEADRIIFTPGGKAMPSTGSDGSGFTILERMGLKLSPIYPALVQLMLEGSFFKSIEGVKVVAKAALTDGKQVLMREEGDVLFTNYGVSGPPILQLSRLAGKSLQEEKPVYLEIHFFDMTSEDMEALLLERFRNNPHYTLDFALVGLINKRLIPVLLKQCALELKVPCAELNMKQVRLLAGILTTWKLPIRATKSWPSAQVTAGGLEGSELTERLELKKYPGMFAAGEVVDVDGLCGGYNLQWAWSSAVVAARGALCSE